MKKKISQIIKEIEGYISECEYTWKFPDIYNHYRNDWRQGFYVSHTCKDIILKFEKELEFIYNTMKYDLTCKVSYNEKDAGGKSNSHVRYFLNGEFIFQQKLPYDDNYCIGHDNRTAIFNERIIGNNLHQTRQSDVSCGSKGGKVREVKFPLSKSKMAQFNVPKEFVIQWLDEDDNFEYPIPYVDELKIKLVTALREYSDRIYDAHTLWAYAKDWAEENGYIMGGSYHSNRGTIRAKFRVDDCLLSFPVYVSEIKSNGGILTNGFFKTEKV
jgi:hypothetical protein